MSNSAEFSSPKTIRYPVAVLFLGSGVAAIAQAGLGTAWLASTSGVARVRELKLFALARIVFEQRDLSLLSWLPEAMNTPFDLHHRGDLITFFALAVVAHLALTWLAAAFLCPVIALAVWLYSPGRFRSAACVWGRAYPAAVLVGFTLPSILAFVNKLVGDDNPRAVTGGSVVLAIGAWCGLLLIFRRTPQVRKVLVGLSWLAGVVASLAVTAGLVVALRGDEQQSQQPTAVPGLPNILLVSIDSLRRDHLHCYGYARETSPTIDALAREGTRFTTVASPTSWTLPAHLTLLTSLPPEEHGVIDNGTGLRPDALTLAEVLWHSGYTTAGFVSGPYLSATYGFSQGFDHYDDYTVAKVSGATMQGSTSPPLLRIVSDWLDRWNAGGRPRPFFVFLHMWDVHYYYAPPPPYDTLFDPGYTGTVTGESFQTGNDGHPGMAPRDLAHIVALYDGEIAFTDLYLGKIVNRLRELGVQDDTIIVVTADHGDEFFEHGNKGHGNALYDETILVPLIVRFPRKVPVATVDAQVRLMDIAPTIMSLAGISPPESFGAAQPKGPYAERDLTPWMTRALATLPSLVAFGDLRVGHGVMPLAAVRTESSKLIRGLADGGKEEFYDLRTDPGEKVNLIAHAPRELTQWRDELTNWRDRWRDQAGLSEHVELSDQQKERLRALGYIQ